ncbi:MAG: 23S rRNA (uracil(1939)-C(5))-methyltransferase RlmD [Deltaproteobacteria bacterium]|nr:MAG: 23S rRNA (uracil(1939)-C(5))-methyltransferase RlmD [Deltaproteobacteria bacterium]
MTVKKGEIIEATITDLAFGGRGLVRVDGMAVFVDPAVPGDRVRARVFKKRKNYAEARVMDVLTPSTDRVPPPCPYNGWCGGCKSQFLDYDRQLVYKQHQVADSLAHIGSLEDIPVHPVIPSEKIFGYRNKMEFSCSDRRWLLPEEMGTDEPVDTDFAMGLHVPGTFYKVLDIDACLLMPELGNRILNSARAFMKNSPHPAYGLRSHQGFWRFLMLRHSVDKDQWMVNIVTATEDRPAVQALADSLRAEYPRIASVVNNVTSRKAGIALGEYEMVLAGDSAITDRIGNRVFSISANSFFQTNTRGAKALYRVVENFSGLTGNQAVVDLYCGAGTIALTLAEQAGSVIGIEISDTAIADAEKNSRINGIDNCRFIRGDIRDKLPGLSVKPDLLIIDPPRAGMHKDVVQQVLALSPERIVYVSCNPATLARDLGLMVDDYDIREVQPVDMFPHTWHIEAVARLHRR